METLKTININVDDKNRICRLSETNPGDIVFVISEVKGRERVLAMVLDCNTKDSGLFYAKLATGMVRFPSPNCMVEKPKSVEINVVV